MTDRKPYDSPHGIEQSRRDFMRDYPDLYGYIALREQAKALDSAGDHISGHHEAANRVWGLAAATDVKWRAMLQRTPPPPPPPIGGLIR